MVGLLVQDLVDPVSRGRGALSHHDDHPEHHERSLHHQQVGVEGDDGPQLQMAVDDHVAPDQQHQGQPQLGQVLDGRRPAGPQVGVLHISPLDLVGCLGQRPQLLLLGGERLHHPHAVDVLVDDGGHLGQPGLDDPGHREHRLPHLHTGEVDERHGDHGHESQGHVDPEHEAEGDQGDAALHQDHGGEGHVHLDRADVRVGPGDELARLHPVVERERHLGQVLIDDVPEVELDPVGRLEEVQPGDVARHHPGDGQPHDPPYVEVQRHRVMNDQLMGDGIANGLGRREGIVDGVTQKLGDLDLEDEAHEGEHQRDDEDLPVRPARWAGPA